MCTIHLVAVGAATAAADSCYCCLLLIRVHRQGSDHFQSKWPKFALVEYAEKRGFELQLFQNVTDCRNKKTAIIPNYRKYSSLKIFDSKSTKRLPNFLKLIRNGFFVLKTFDLASIFEKFTITPILDYAKTWNSLHQNPHFQFVQLKWEKNHDCFSGRCTLSLTKCSIYVVVVEGAVKHVVMCVALLIALECMSALNDFIWAIFRRFLMAFVRLWVRTNGF